MTWVIMEVLVITWTGTRVGCGRESRAVWDARKGKASSTQGKGFETAEGTSGDKFCKASRGRFDSEGKRAAAIAGR